MRILYENLIDDLASTNITALTEATLYEATELQDQRLTTQWRTTAATDQTIIFNASSNTIVGGNIGLVTGSAATNLVKDPEDLTTANWIESNASAFSAINTILGMTATEIDNSGVSLGYVWQSIAGGTFSTDSTPIITAIARKGSIPDTTARMLAFDISASSAIGQVDVTWATKAVAYSQNGSKAIAPVWIDDNTVQVFLKCAALSTTASVLTPRFYAGPAGTTALSTIWTAALVIDNTYPVPYVATSRTAVETEYAYRMPPSGKFIIDCEFKPFSPFDSSTDINVFAFYVGANNRLVLFYDIATDKIRIYWIDGSTGRSLYSNPQFYASTFNSYIRVTTSLDLSIATTSGSLIYVDGTLGDSAWDDDIDVLSSSTFTTLSIGHSNNTGRFDGVFRFARIYGGNLDSDEVADSEANLDSELADRELLFTRDYQNQFSLDTVAIMGHNIGEGAAVTMQLNDWNEWNYTDGSGSSIIQHTMTWDDETILKMFTKVKRQYAKLTINDPNNDDTILKIGRIWAGPYLNISPSSLDDFRVTKTRSDRNIYGRNRQKWSDEGVGWRRFELSYPPSESSVVTAIQTMYDTVGNHSSIIFCNFDELRDYPIVSPCYASIVGDITFNHRGRQKYTYNLSLEEDR